MTRALQVGSQGHVMRLENGESPSGGWSFINQLTVMLDNIEISVEQNYQSIEFKQKPMNAFM